MHHQAPCPPSRPGVYPHLKNATLKQMAEKMKAGMPQPDGSIKPEATMPLDHVGQAIAMMANLPLDSNVLEMTIKATKMPFEGRG